MATIRVTASRPEVMRAIRLYADILAGKAADVDGIGRAAQLRLGFSFLELVKDAFDVKSNGGTDEAGIKWPPLSKRYLAYGKGPPSTRRAGRSSPGGKDGFMSPAQLKLWWKDYRQALAWLAASMPIGAAKGKAAAIAWSKAKQRGVKTKLQVFGNRKTEILRDRGILLQSLTPGAPPTRSGTYTPTQGQIMRADRGAVIVGTNVPYASAHHRGTGNMPRRALWPDQGRIPARWWAQMLANTTDGIEAALVTLIGRA
jgi:hypothetical protein